ncbi:MAG TPA: AbrB/MazE/SpoVT family DNA-binding domain-containing protein [Rhodanobacteraceae bacterium]|nr:AbrB/MazE/SpoVT family DNA-binding domain-containing protein [Rhodanobacteraceae bacterium]
MSSKSRMTSQSQVSVPVQVRRQLGLAPGSTLVWEDAGEYVVVRRAGAYSSADIHEAIFDGKPARKSLKDLKAGIAAHLRKRHARD